MTNDMDRDDQFSRRISQPLQAAPGSDPAFTDRVMAAVRDAAAADSAERRRPWVLRAFVVRLTPLAAMALAAGIALAVVGSRQILAPRAETRVAAVDTVHVVRFVLANEAARTASSVTLAGSFNDWNTTAIPLTHHAESGVWSISVPLAPGRHEYAFVVTDRAGVRWLPDPTALAIRDEFGATTSVFTVGGST
jgi:hypothetical protein